MSIPHADQRHVFVLRRLRWLIWGAVVAILLADAAVLVTTAREPSPVSPAAPENASELRACDCRAALGSIA